MSEEIYLFPEEFSVEPKYNSRLWPPTQDDLDLETVSIADLAKSIASQGQLTSCVCVVDSARPLPYVLIAGHRRRRAMADLNAARGDKPLMKLRCRVDRTGKDPLQQAIISNLYEKSYSPMDIASAIHHLRKFFRQQGLVGNKTVEGQRIAVYLGLHFIDLMRYEKLLTADEDTCRAVHTGLISVPAAIDMLRTVESNRRDVLELAANIQSKGLGRKSGGVRGRRVAQLDSKRMEGKLSMRSVRKAITELGAGIAPLPKSRTDIGQMFYDLDRRTYGWYNGEIRVWARSALAWMQGVEPTEKFMEKFAAMTKYSMPGNFGDEDKRAAQRGIRREKVLMRMPGTGKANDMIKYQGIKGAIEL